MIDRVYVLRDSVSGVVGDPVVVSNDAAFRRCLRQLVSYQLERDDATTLASLRDTVAYYIADFDRDAMCVSPVDPVLVAYLSDFLRDIKEVDPDA